MILHVSGDINRYYVQTLAMIYFPGASFPTDEEPGPGIPELNFILEKTETGYKAITEASLDGFSTRAEKERENDGTYSDERVRKLVTGASVTQALGDLMEYSSSWGILIGVRPSKVATELLSSGNSKAKTKKILVQDFLTFPKKAALAIDVAVNEKPFLENQKPNDFSLYVSIPFCPSRCAYCSFVSYTSKRFLSLIPEYVDRLLLDIDKVLSTALKYGLNLRTIYFGGGTPTILDCDQLERVLSFLQNKLGDRVPEEFTFESGRPDTITREKLEILKKYGIKRISVNPQTLCPKVLEGIGRHHTVEDFYKAYNLAREVGIESINTDLIAGLPGDNFKDFSASVDGIIALNPDNVTVHTFCVKRSSDLKHEGNAFSMRGGDVGKCVDYSQIKLQQAGYIPYYMYRQKNTVGNFENVGFAKPGTEGRYNIYMMEEVHSILAVGAGAVSKFVHLSKDEKDKTKITRYFNPKYPYEYLDKGNCDELICSIKEFFDKELKNET